MEEHVSEQIQATSVVGEDWVGVITVSVVYIAQLSIQVAKNLLNLSSVVLVTNLTPKIRFSQR